MIASLLKSPGLFSVFWPFSIMLLFGWSPLDRQLPNLPVLLLLLYCCDVDSFDSSSLLSKPYGTVQSAITTNEIIVTLMFYIFFYFSGNIYEFLNLFRFFYFQYVVRRNEEIKESSSSFLLALDLVYWSELGYMFVSQNTSVRLRVSFLWGGGFWFVLNKISVLSNFHLSCTISSRSLSST